MVICRRKTRIAIQHQERKFWEYSACSQRRVVSTGVIHYEYFFRGRILCPETGETPLEHIAAVEINDDNRHAIKLSGNYSVGMHGSDRPEFQLGQSETFWATDVAMIIGIVEAMHTPQVVRNHFKTEVDDILA
ncbi:MAG: hypothetical protein JWN23_438 [Rhodocyclales bacterium]|nr:hypothetical protein [Rhodocyclales bacterium]